MFFKRNKMEVVPASELTDYSERFEELERMRAEEGYATRKHVVIASSVPVVASVGFAAHQYFNKPVMIETFTPLTVNALPQQTGIIADKSLEAFATILDPFIQILVAISFPVASLVITVGFFIIMFGMKEKALTMIMNAGIGYVLVQMLPLFNALLKTVGEAV